MALINCPECGKEISDSAMNCPNCGYPMQVESASTNKLKEDNKIPKKIPIVLMLCMAAVIIMMILIQLGIRSKSTISNGIIGNWKSSMISLDGSEFSTFDELNAYSNIFSKLKGTLKIKKDGKFELKSESSKLKLEGFWELFEENDYTTVYNLYDNSSQSEYRLILNNMDNSCDLVLDISRTEQVTIRYTR